MPDLKKQKPQVKLNRYLVRRLTKEVFIWTEILAANHPDLEEVLAASPDVAVNQRAMADPKHISIVEIESMKKADLIVWASLKLELDLDASEKHSTLVDQVKQAIMTLPSGVNDEPEEVEVDMRSDVAKKGGAVNRTTAMGSTSKARGSAGV